MNRRDFVTTTALAAGGLSFLPSILYGLNNDAGIMLSSPMNTKIRLKILNDGLIHEDAWEGSCRTGLLENLTYEAEKERLSNRMQELKKTLKTLQIPQEVEILEPVTIHSWVEKGNPDIMLEDTQLDLLSRDNEITDLYVAGSPFIGYRIAMRYRKPVCILQPAGWGVDGAAGIRALGIDSFHVNNWEELFHITRLIMARKAFANTRLLNVTNFPGRVPYGVVSGITNMDMIRMKYGMDCTYIDYNEFFSHMDRIERDKTLVKLSEKIAADLLKNAFSSDMTKDNIAKSVLFYIAAAKMMQKHGCNAFTIECFELCSSLNPWKRKFTPCLTHALLKDNGIPSGCEGDINALLAMMVQMYLSNKAIYMGNPNIHKESNILTLHHSVASLRMLGLDKAPSPYYIHSFMRAGYGATLRHAFIENAGEKITVGRFDPSGTKIMISSGEVIGGSGLSGFGCSQNVEMLIPNGPALWRASQNYGHHLAFVYGDYTSQISDLGELMGFEVENIK
jgi:hypothetical protein